MAKNSSTWKNGRGKLGPLAPLLGTWRAEADSPRGVIRCTRTFTPILDGKYIQLAVRWEFDDGEYEELALFGINENGTIGFWSFTSDGKRSEGTLADVTDIHPQAIGFEAQMPAGLARTAYWPDETSGFRWVVESRNKKGWNRFVEHHYTAIQAPEP